MSDENTSRRLHLEQLRQVVDKCDEQLLELIARRQSAVKQLVAHKKHSGEAIFVPEREQAIIQRLTEQAKKLELEPQLIHDLLQRIMRDSYAQQSQMEYPAATSSKVVCIIGGNGQFGQLLAQQFSRSGHQVRVLEQDSWSTASELLIGVDLVLIAVPIESTATVIERLSSLSDILPKRCVLADITSVKSMPLAEMLRLHSGPVIGLHPMFGPQLPHLARQLLLYTPGRNFSECEWVIEQFVLWGCHTQSISADDHDQLMALVQALRHFVTFVAGWHLQQSNVDLERLLQVSSPIYRIELALIGRLFAQQPELYVDIILNAKAGSQVISEYGDIFQQAFDWVKQGERDKLIERFCQVAEYFSGWEDELFSQSDVVLESFRERVY